MAFQLNKIIENDTIDEWREQINVSFSALGYSPDKIVSFSMTHSPLGGSFEVVLEAQTNSYPYSFGGTEVYELTPVTVASLGSGAGATSYTGAINKVTPSVSRSGVLLKISGVLRPYGLSYTPSISFSNASPFIGGDGTILPDPFIPSGITNHHRLIGLSAKDILSKLSTVSGITIDSGNLGLDYKVWAFEAAKGDVISAMETVAQYGGSNVVYRRDGTLKLVGWGGNLDTHTIDACELLDGLDVDYESAEFTDVIVQPDSSITPYNSTYGGTPESLGTLTFKAGPTNRIDTGSGVASERPSTDWRFPKTLGNDWYTFTAGADEFASKLGLFLGTNSFWDAEQVNRSEMSFSTTFSKKTKSDGTIDDVETLVGRTQSQTTFDVLYSWDLATKKFENAGDLYHYVYILPSDRAPDFTEKFDFDCTDSFNVKLEGYGKAQNSNPDVDHPTAIGDITPRGWWVPVYADESLTVAGFANDGSFFVGLRPHNWQVRDRGGFQIKASNEKLEELDILTQVKNGPPVYFAPWPSGTDFDSEAEAVLVDTSMLSGFKVRFKTSLTAESVEEKKAKDAKLALGVTPETVHGSKVLNGTGDIIGGKKEIERRARIEMNVEWTAEINNHTNSDTVKKNIILEWFSRLGQLINSGYSVLPLQGVEYGRVNFLIDSIHVPTPALDRVDADFFDSTFDNPSMTALMDGLPDALYQDKPLRLAKVIRRGGLWVDVQNMGSTLVNSTSSGTVDSGREPLEGDWTAYGLKRKVFPPVVVCSVGGSPVFHFDGNIPGVAPVNPKNLSGQLITDYWSTSLNTTHAFIIAKKLADYLNSDFVSFTARYPYKGDKLPQPGDKFTVTGANNYSSLMQSSVSGTVTQVRFSVSGGSGAIVEVQVGRLPII